jgi:phosphohistidine phosphatase SixA
MAQRSAAAAPPHTLLVLVRHGDAGDALARPDRDALRALTAKGRKQARRAGKSLARLGLAPRDVWTSRLRRSAQTAEIAAKACAASPRCTATAALAPDAIPERIAKSLFDTPPPPLAPIDGKLTSKRRRTSGRARRVRPTLPAAPTVRWIVGHEPHLSRLLGYLTGAPATAFDVRKGTFAVVECDGRGPVAAAGRLVALVSPDTLRALRKTGPS